VKFNALREILAVALLFSGSWGLRHLERRLSDQPAARRAQWGELLGHGGIVAVLGGMRSVVASGFWLQTNLAWEQRDVQATTLGLNLTVAADERSDYFWLNGARMLAYDLSEWRVSPDAPRVVREKVQREQGNQALEFLRKGIQWHGANAAFYIEMGNIYLRRMDNLTAAAECYRKAAEQPAAPYYAARIHASLLQQLARPEEALAWLKKVLPTLPANEPAARRALVQAWMEALQREVRAVDAEKKKDENRKCINWKNENRRNCGG
jgi:tetratricopeptide (TPR) repeat protein